MSHGLQSSRKCIAWVILLNHLDRDAVSSPPRHTRERLRVPPRRHTQRGHSTGTWVCRLWVPGCTSPWYGCPALTSDRDGRHLNQIPASLRSSRASRRMHLHFLKAPRGKRPNNGACPPPERGPTPILPALSCVPSTPTPAGGGSARTLRLQAGHPLHTLTHTHSLTHSHMPQRWLIQQVAFPEALTTTGVTLTSPKQCLPTLLVIC